MRRTVRAFAVAALSVVAGSVALASPASAEPRLVPVNGAGSTWSSNAIDNWRRELVPSGVTANYAASGATDGRNRFANSTVDFAVSEIPYGMRDSFAPTEPLPERQFRYLPVVGGGLSFAYNLRLSGRQIDNLRLSGPSIVRIFTREITRWDDPRIKADNPGLNLPPLDIVPVVRLDASGTTLQLTQWMSARYPELWGPYCQARGGTPPCGPTRYFPTNGHIGQSQSTGVVGYTAQSNANGAITYAEYNYAINARLPVVKVLNQAGYYVAPTASAVAVALTEAEVVDNPPDPATHLTQKLDRVYANPDPRAYPLSAYAYMIVPAALGPSFTEDKGYTLGRFATHALCVGQQSADGLGYAPLPINLVRAGFAQIRAIPGAAVPDDPIASCENPTFAPDGTDTLLRDAPQPPECDNAATGQQCPGSGGQGQGTLTTLTASNTSIAVDEPVTLTATVWPIDATGTVEFLRAPLSSIAQVPLAAGVASFTTMLPRGTHPLIARFVPSDPTPYLSSTSPTVVITVSPSTGQPRQTLVAEIAPGAFSLAIAAPNAGLAGGTVGGEATGALAEATVTDLRGSNVGWNVTAQTEDFAQATGTAAIAGAQLGWNPSAGKVSGSGAVLAGSPVAPGTALGGLADGATLCSAAAGGSAGTFTCGAALTLRIPDATAPGSYAATLTLTLA